MHDERSIFARMKKKHYLMIGIPILILIVLFIVVSPVTVDGNEVGVLETWMSGVIQTPYPAKTYFLFPGFAQTMYKYPTSLQIFVMNDKQEADGEAGEGRARDAYKVQSSEGQDMWVSLSVQWRIDPSMVVLVHTDIHPPTNKFGAYMGEVALRPILQRVVKDKATLCPAIDAYSGAGLVQLQTDIFNALSDSEGVLRKTKGIIVENFVIEGIELNKDYIGEIIARQIATQKTLKEKEAMKAAEAAALTAKAVAQADLNTQVVAAERDKQIGILKAEEQAQVRVLDAEAKQKEVLLQAEAEKQKLVLEATGNRDASLLQAEGILAVGKAEAEAKKLQLSAYAVPGADAFVKIEVANAFAQSTKEIKGYLPQDMNVFTLGTHFNEAVELLCKGTKK